MTVKKKSEGEEGDIAKGGSDKGDGAPGESVEERLKALEEKIGTLKEEQRQEDNKVSIICFSGEWDRLFAALTIASGSLAMGQEVHLFFTFWAVPPLRAKGKQNRTNKSFLQKMFNRMIPYGPQKSKLSHFNFCGLGKFMMKRIMKKKGVEDIDVLFQEVKEMGAHFHMCDTTTELFGLECQEIDIDDNLNQCGVATFLSHALKSRIVLFV
jgi:peroxiredoxin family protein